MFSYPDSLVPVLRSVLVLPLCASVEPGLIVASEGRFCWILENVVRDNAGLHVGAQGNFDLEGWVSVLALQELEVYSSAG